MSIFPSPEERKKVLDRFIKDGPWALLFLALLSFVLWTNNAREARYIQTMEKLSTALGVVQAIDQRTILIGQDVKELLYRVK